MKFYAYHKIKFKAQDVLDLHQETSLSVVLDFIKHTAFANGWSKIARILISPTTIENYFNPVLFNDGDLIVDYFGIKVYCLDNIGEYEAVVVCA